MIISNKNEFKNNIKAGKRLLGLDLGSKIIGIAVSDPMLSIASPIIGLQRKKFTEDALKLCQICTEYNVGGLVIGLPINMDGSEGSAAQSAKHFGMNLQADANFSKLDIPIIFWDERLSTQAAEKLMLSFDTTRHRRSKAIDKLAASYILQGFLDSLGGK